MEFCRRLELADRVRHAGFPLDFKMNVVYCTSLRGYLIERQDYPSLGEQPPVPFSPENKFRCPQTMFDPLLAEALRDYRNVQLLYRHRLDDFAETNDGVRAHVRDLDSRETITIDAQYLIACDGSGSGIAKMLGVTLTGNPALSYSVNAVIHAPNLGRWHDKGDAERYLFIGPNGTWSNMTVVDGREHWRFTVIGSEEKLNLEHLDIAAEIRRAMGSDEIPFRVLAIAPWRRSELIAKQFRVGRVFLAGDSAHTMSPTGGHGMNTGAGDAMDLGWKLEAILRGWGGPALLDSYQAERRPVAERNAAASSQNFRTWLSAERCSKIMEDSDEGRRTRAEVGKHLKDALRIEWDSWGIQLGYRYEGSPICIADGTPATPDDPSEYIQSARPGGRAPHAWMADGRSTLDLFGRGFVLLRLGKNAPDAGPLVTAAKARLVPLSVIDCADSDIQSLYESALVLVRPDGHVAWRSNMTPANPGQIVDTLRGAVVADRRFQSGSPVLAQS
jgi:2-polyprenyl-6-methoxyphenol hydroxylase-like FAD-dependent oxidoreductase